MKPRIDNIINKLMKAKNPGSYDFESCIEAEDLKWLCLETGRIFRQDPVLLRLSPPITVCGDVHGQFLDVLDIFKKGGPLPKTSYLFMGDYVGRGSNSIETISYLFAMKVKYPKYLYLLRGNHETAELSRTDGFFQELQDRGMAEIWRCFTEAFRWLPIAAIVGKRIFCVHGGISPFLQNLQQIRDLKRPIDLEDSELVNDLLWSDPAESGDGWQENSRGTSCTYGLDVVTQFLSKNRLDLLCRGHQLVMDGYDFPFKGSQSVITIFTAPNYCEEYQNAGALLQIGSDLTCSFQFLEPKNYEEDSYSAESECRQYDPSDYSANDYEYD